MSLSLLRAGRPIASFLSCLGQVRETRLTATLAFLTAHFPERFLPLLGQKPGRVGEVTIEETDEGDRFDVLVQGDHPPIVIEGKKGLRQDSGQLRRYARSQRRRHGRKPILAVVDQGSAKSQGLSESSDGVRRHFHAIVRRTWTEVAALCRTLARSRRLERADPLGVAVARDFDQHLKEAGMTNDARGEIYMRELSEVGSVELYFRHHIYKCQPEFIRSAGGNLYFAPYFTRVASERISERNLVPVGEGVSYVSRIIDVQVLSKKRVREHLKTLGVKEIKQCHSLITRAHHAREVLVMRLGAPHRLFLAPVSKAQMGLAAATLGSRSFTLDDMLAAASATRAHRADSSKRSSRRRR